jgi:small subunit ribosomal protein S21
LGILGEMRVVARAWAAHGAGRKKADFSVENRPCGCYSRFFVKGVFPTGWRIRNGYLTGRFPMRRDGPSESERVVIAVIKIKSRGNESIDQMLKRFKKLCEKEGLVKDIKRNSYYEKPSERMRRKRRKAVKRAQQEGAEQTFY